MKTTEPSLNCYVYFIQMGFFGPIKIGFSENNPLGRLRDLQVGNPEELRLIGYLRCKDRSTERTLHEEFRALKIRGEWFANSNILINYVKDTCIREHLPLPSARLEDVLYIGHRCDECRVVCGEPHLHPVDCRVEPCFWHKSYCGRCVDEGQKEFDLHMEEHDIYRCSSCKQLRGIEHMMKVKSRPYSIYRCHGECHSFVESMAAA